MKLVYYPEIAQAKIDKAIEGTNLPNEVSSFDIQKEKGSRRNWFFALLGVGIVSFFCSYNYGSSLFILGSIGVILYALFWQLPQMTQIKSSPGEVSPELAAEQFYKTVLQDKFGTMIEAYRLLAPAATEQRGAIIVESFKSTWVEFADQEILNRLFEKYKTSQKKKVQPYGYMVVFRDIHVNTNETQPKVRNIQCTSSAVLRSLHGGGTFANKDVENAKIELNNVAVQIGAKWFLMTGFPGQLMENDESKLIS